MTEIIKGRLLANKIKENVGKIVEELENPPGLAAILVGDDEASHLYVSLKEKAAKEAGIFFEKHEYPADAKELTIIRKIKKLNRRKDIHGILVQLPLPKSINENRIIGAIDPKKDVDGFHPKNIGLFDEGVRNLIPPVTLAIIKLIDATRQPLRGKSIVILGNSEIFAHPITELLNERGAETNFVKSDSSAVEAKTRIADIIVVAVGKRNFLKKDMVKDGAVIIDVGTNKKDDKTVGDASQKAKSKASFISPVPGGVGPLTVAFLLKNVLSAMRLQKEKEN